MIVYQFLIIIISNFSHFAVSSLPISTASFIVLISFPPNSYLCFSISIDIGASVSKVTHSCIHLPIVLGILSVLETNWIRLLPSPKESAVWLTDRNIHKSMGAMVGIYKQVGRKSMLHESRVSKLEGVHQVSKAEKAADGQEPQSNWFK